MEDERSSSHIVPILRDHGALVSLMSATTAALTIGYLESLLELHLETMFAVSVTTVGLCFLTMSVAYTLVTILSGYCADKLIHPGTLTIIGLLLLLTSFILLGPAPFLPLPPSFSLTILGLLLQGAGAGAVIVSSYSSALRATLMIPGFSASVSTYSIVSGLWTSAFALGNFAGPSVAGVIYEQVMSCLLSIHAHILIIDTILDWFPVGYSDCGGDTCDNVDPEPGHEEAGNEN